MEGEFEIVLPYMRCASEEITEEFKKDYELTGAAMNDLHARGRKKLDVLLPQWEKGDLSRRISWVNREVEALWSSPYAYALMVVDSAMGAMGNHGKPVRLLGAWEKSLYAWLMGMTREEPEERDPAEFIREPLVLEVRQEDRQFCSSALLGFSWVFGLNLRIRDSRDFLLLPAGQQEHPDAPVIRVLCTK